MAKTARIDFFISSGMEENHPDSRRGFTVFAVRPKKKTIQALTPLPLLMSGRFSFRSKVPGWVLRNSRNSKKDILNENGYSPLLSEPVIQTKLFLRKRGTFSQKHARSSWSTEMVRIDPSALRMQGAFLFRHRWVAFCRFCGTIIV